MKPYMQKAITFRNSVLEIGLYSSAIQKP